MPVSNRELLSFFHAQQGWAQDRLQEFVLAESPTDDSEAVNRLGARIEQLMSEQGVTVEHIPQAGVGDHLACSWGENLHAEESPMLLLGHMDTIWPVGQLARMPYRREGNRLFGPGVFDMKAGLVLMLLIRRAFAELPMKPRRPVKCLLSSDEERGSLESKHIVENVARPCRYVLCLEPPLPGNFVKTSRKGVYRFTLEVEGLAAHAGVNHEKGVNALEETAHQILLLQSMTDYDSGTTVNVGTLRVDNPSNVVPDRAVVEIDVRARSARLGEEITRRILSLMPVHPKARLKISGGIRRPPLERSEGIVNLFRQAAALARELDFALGEGSTGGGSDGSLTAAMGIPTLDGLGVEGDGPHALHEHIRIDDIPRKAALLTRLIERV